MGNFRLEMITIICTSDCLHLFWGETKEKKRKKETTQSPHMWYTSAISKSFCLSHA